MEQLNIIAQFLFWALFGLWMWGVRFPFMEQVIGGIAIFVALLIVI